MQADDKRLPLFLILVFVLSIPFWILGSLFEVQLLPGLPIGSFAVFVPGIAAGLMAYQSGQFPAVWRLVRRSFDPDRIRDKKWYFLFFCFNPIVAVLSFLIMRTMGIAVPNPEPLKLAVVPLVAFTFNAALGEELGCTGYATELFLRRWGVLPGGVLLGLIWAVFHLVLLTQVDRSLQWIAWWSLSTRSLRTIMVWLFRHAGDSVFAAAKFLNHWRCNAIWFIQITNSKPVVRDFQARNSGGHQCSCGWGERTDRFNIAPVRTAFTQSGCTGNGCLYAIQYVSQT